VRFSPASQQRRVRAMLLGRRRRRGTEALLPADGGRIPCFASGSRSGPGPHDRFGDFALPLSAFDGDGRRDHAHVGDTPPRSTGSARGGWPLRAVR